MIRTILIALFCAAAYGQNLAVFTAVRETTGTTEKVTIQQPATGSRTVVMRAAYVYCSAGCDVTQFRNGTAATTTALARTPLNPEAVSTASALAFHTSNVGAGTQIGNTVTLGTATGYEKGFELDGIKMTGDGTGTNYTISITNAGGGTIRVGVKWEEQ